MEAPSTITLHDEDSESAGDDEGPSGCDDDFPDFCAELRARTRAIHDESDRLVNLKLVVVLTDTRLWGQALGEFYHVFRTMEDCLTRHKSHPVLGAIRLPQAAYRAKAFEQDLEFYLGTGWADAVTPSAQASAYCGRLRQLSEESPVLLVAYVHSMYLGLLAGGQIIKRIVRRTLGVSNERGLAVFDFGELSRVQLKSEFMESINRLALSRQDKEDIVEEKKIVFRMNNLIVENIRPTLVNYSRLMKAGAIAAAGVAVVVFGFVRYLR